MSKKNTSPERQIDNGQYVFCLYVTGASPNSLRAIANTKNICDEYIKEGYELEVIDVYQQPVVAREENIIALPMLVRKHPLPEKRMVGDMSDIERVLKSIGLENHISK